MLRHVAMAAIVVLGLLAAEGPLAAQTSLDAEIDAAIEAGLKQIWSTQKDNGLFSDLDPKNPPVGTPGAPVYPGDREVMALAVLAYAGESLDKPEMKKALKAVAEIELDKIYTLSFRVIALAKLCEQDPKYVPGLRAAIKRDVDLIIEIQQPNGGWHYNKAAAKYWDFSNTQFAILALRDAMKAGVEVPAEPFQRALKLYLEKQHDDGGWSYGRDGFDTVFSTGSMTAPAVASLFIIRDVLNPGQGCPCKAGRSAGRRDAALDKAIARGVEWLGKNFVATKNPPEWQHYLTYWLYAAERVGQKTGLKYFGQHDWYLEGAKFLLPRRNADGAWGGFSDTAFAMLFLIKGRGPILLNKLMYDGPWDAHPNDAESLADFVSKLKEQHFNWQVIHLDIPVEEMHDAPILYITAEAAVNFSDEHKKKLRQFTDTGGTIFLEASCGNRAAMTWIEKLCQELWPEWELQLIDRDHPLWTADVKVAGQPPLLRGLGDGLRTFLFVSPMDISCKWHTGAAAGSTNLFQLGANLYAYATDRAKIRSRFARRGLTADSPYASQTTSWTRRDLTLNVARLAHGGLWTAGRRYNPWPVLGQSTKDAFGLAIAEGEPIKIGQDIPADVALLHLAGRGQVTLGDKSVAALKAYLAAGGFLFAEATVGDEAFDKSVRDVLTAAGLQFKPLDAASPILTGQVGSSGQGFAVKNVGYTLTLLSQRIGNPQPSLFGLHLGDKLVGLYSPFDITFAQTGCKAFGSRGYAPADARALATNLALFAAERATKPATP